MKRPIRRLKRTPESGPIIRPPSQYVAMINRCSRSAACMLCSLHEYAEFASTEDAGANALSDSCFILLNRVMVVFFHFLNHVRCGRIAAWSQSLHNKPDHRALDCE